MTALAGAAAGLLDDGLVVVASRGEGNVVLADGTGSVVNGVSGALGPGAGAAPCARHLETPIPPPAITTSATSATGNASSHEDSLRGDSDLLSTNAVAVEAVAGTGCEGAACRATAACLSSPKSKSSTVGATVLRSASGTPTSIAS